MAKNCGKGRTRGPWCLCQWFLIWSVTKRYSCSSCSVRSSARRWTRAVQIRVATVYLQLQVNRPKSISIGYAGFARTRRLVGFDRLEDACLGAFCSAQTGTLGNRFSGHRHLSSGARRWPSANPRRSKMLKQLEARRNLAGGDSWTIF